MTQSLTIRALALIIITQVLRWLGFDDTVAAEYSGQIADLIFNGVTLVSAAVAVYGRIRAKGPLTKENP